jgi:hypothetical protein
MRQTWIGWVNESTYNAREDTSWLEGGGCDRAMDS